ncbi:hypothetical protein ATL42_2077 [Sanguibacter antarcticus]|uniref:Uncharacterized protein n=1 Tax=Sanguibacter antarcticus TaxID=372484 RepID=A0A2A9E5Q5_9MICO|nr:hypothetical protein ATL42_2077 [Sanguibacter antarcticus]
MAEQAQLQDEYRANMQSCVEAAGWSVTITHEGGVVEPFNGQTEMDRYAIDRDACRESLGLHTDGAALTADQYELIYGRQVQTRECLVAQGYTMATPPSKEAYVEAALTGDSNSTAAWSPYLDSAFEKLAESEYNRLQEECPEPWWPSAPS